MAAHTAGASCPSTARRLSNSRVRCSLSLGCCAHVTLATDRRHNLVADAERAHGAPLLSSAALGMDDATYRLLMELQFREITPEDYQTLTVLDETVKPKSLDHCKLSLFPTMHIVDVSGTMQVCRVSHAPSSHGHQAAAHEWRPLVAVPQLVPRVPGGLCCGRGGMMWCVLRHASDRC